jgi:glycosyltransferase involved in cell wall biosynthesis
MAAFYGACDLFVFSSRGEGFGLPALEAMACGCAVITTDSGGVRQFASDAQNCLMTSPNDAQALAHAIESLVHDAECRKALADAGRETAQAYDQTAVLDRFCRFLVDLGSR